MINFFERDTTKDHGRFIAHFLSPFHLISERHLHHVHKIPILDKNVTYSITYIEPDHHDSSVIFLDFSYGRNWQRVAFFLTRSLHSRRNKDFGVLVVGCIPKSWSESCQNWVLLIVEIARGITILAMSSSSSLRFLAQQNNTWRKSLFPHRSSPLCHTPL